MCDKINVLGICVDVCTTKDAAKTAINCLDSEAVSVISFVTVDSVMAMEEHSELKTQMNSFDRVFAGEKTILEAAEYDQKKQMQELDVKGLLNHFLTHLQKNYKRVYLLVESEEEAEELYEYLEKKYKGIHVCGMAKVSVTNRSDLMVVNSINGSESDCVLSMLSSPLQEDFIVSNRQLLHTRLWMGVGKNLLIVKKAGFGKGKIAQILLRKLFKKEMEKQRII